MRIPHTLNEQLAELYRRRHALRDAGNPEWLDRETRRRRAQIGELEFEIELLEEDARESAPRLAEIERAIIDLERHKSVEAARDSLRAGERGTHGRGAGVEASRRPKLTDTEREIKKLIRLTATLTAMEAQLKKRA